MAFKLKKSSKKAIECDVIKGTTRTKMAMDIPLNRTHNLTRNKERYTQHRLRNIKITEYKKSRNKKSS